MRTPPWQQRQPPTLRQPTWYEDVESPAWRSRAGAGSGRPTVPHMRQKRPHWTGTAARGITGSLAVGSLLLALGLVVAQIWATHNGQQGPGIGILIAHFVTAGVAMTLQALADRKRDLAGGLSALGVLVVVLGSLWFWWLL
jgi:hypothetical protein